ncbi:hypothetical protein BJ742DRAFT_827562 [Cladochytrium replicatum]|nr:hypothetical protein BJ742DRAFT_827562 [Cladochytrium replicatum]
MKLIALSAISLPIWLLCLYFPSTQGADPQKIQTPSQTDLTSFPTAAETTNLLSTPDGVFPRLYPSSYDPTTKYQPPCGGANTRSNNPGNISTTNITVISINGPHVGIHVLNILDASLNLKGEVLNLTVIPWSEIIVADAKFYPSRYGLGAKGSNGTIQHVFMPERTNETWYQCADFTVGGPVIVGGPVSDAHQKLRGSVWVLVICVWVSIVLLV